MRLLLLLGVLAQQVPEPPSRDEIVWDVPGGCPDRDGLIAAIERRLGRSLADVDLALVGQVARHAGSPRYRVELRLRVDGRTQVRTLAAERCASIVDAAALLIALAVAESDEPGPPPELPPEAPPAIDAAVDPAPPIVPMPAPAQVEIPVETEGPVVPVDAVPAASSTPARVGPGLLVRLHGGPEFGAVRGASGAFGLVVGVLWRRFRLELGGLFVAPKQAVLAPTSARVFVLAGAARGCARIGRGDLEVPVCGGLELGGLRADVTGPGARSSTAPWLAGVAAVGLAWHVHPRVSLTLALQAQVHLTRPSFEVSGPEPTETLFTPLPASGRLLAGVECRIRDPW